MILFGNRAMGQQAAATTQNQPILWNTLITGVIREREGFTVDDQTKVVIYQDGKQIAATKVRSLMFVIDLKGIAKPESVIEVCIPGKSEGYGWERKVRRIEVQLHRAQNLLVQLVYSQTNPDHIVRPMRLKTGGLSDI